MQEEEQSTQIIRLQQALNRAIANNSNAEDLPLLSAGSHTQSLSEKLESLNIALLHHTIENIAQRHEQIALAMDFSRYVTFFARHINPDVSLWTQEINDDVALQLNLLQGAHSDVQILVDQASGHPETLNAVKKHASVLAAFNRQQARRIGGRELYDLTEKPEGMSAGMAHTQLDLIRKNQRDMAYRGVEQMISRGLLSLKRVHLLRSEILPLFKAASDPSLTSWEQEIKNTAQRGSNALLEARALHSHLQRLSQPLPPLSPKAE